MISMEDWLTIKNLKRANPSISNRKIGRLLNISHNTVKKALENEKGPIYNRENKENPEIIKFKDFIEESLLVKGLSKSRILRDIKSKGYKSSKSAFYRYVSKIKLTPKRAFKPYETAPAEQSQFDWSPYDITINGIKTRVYVFCYILGYSRYRILECSLSQSEVSVLEAIESSIIETGGVTMRIQTDNASCFVISHPNSDTYWNKQYLQFCGHYNIKPTRSLVKHPWSKGKVERPFAFLEEQFIKGNEFESFEDFHRRLKCFQNDVNNMVHHTTNKTPKFLFDEESAKLGNLPASKFSHTKNELRKVSSDCLISFNGNRYSVPHIFVRQEVWLKVSQGNKLLIYSNKNVEIAQHDISLQKKQVIINQEHYKNYRSEKGNWQRLSEEFLNQYPDFEWFLTILKDEKKINSAYSLTRILEYAKLYEQDDLIKSFDYCNKFNVYNHKIVMNYLLNYGKEKKISTSLIKDDIRKSIESKDIKRDLKVYNIYI